VLVGKYWGINGICFALVIRAIVLFPILIMLTDRVIGLRPLTFIKTLVPSLVCGSGMVVFTMICSKIVPGDSFARDLLTLVLGSAGGIIVYFLMLFFLFKNASHSLLEILLSLKKAA
jgi:hypothetical protein